MENPQILALDIDEDTIENIKNENYHVYNGSVGHLTTFDAKYGFAVNCLLQHDYPANFHEFNILIIDLNNNETVKYVAEDHKRTYNKTGSDAYIRCNYPQTVFDPRPYSLSLLEDKISSSLKNGLLLIVFCSEDETIEYKFSSSSYEEHITKTMYDFYYNTPEHINKNGIKTIVQDENIEILNFLRKYNNDFSYNITFNHPTILQEGKHINDPTFYPLIYNSNNDIISFCSLPNDNSGIFFFPQLDNKKEFLREFLQEIAPSILPKLFPNNLKNSWINNEQYFLPHQADLLLTQENIKLKYIQDLEDKEKVIAENYDKYKFLHQLLTETDAQLVFAVIYFLKWLGFEGVKDYDELNESKIKEEDIQIETNKGLIIFEVKGIGGTSKDSDCGQIGKIKFRRCEQRGNFNVYAHYIVNHQRHLPPLDRKNPPFTEHQIADAKNEKRGLLTTWQLFKLYFLIEKGIINKEQARATFYRYGYLNFIPEEYYLIGSPKEFYKNNTTIVLDLPTDTVLKVNDELLIDHKGDFQKAQIQSLQIDGKNVELAVSCEVGIQLNLPINKGSVVYKI